MLRNLAIYLTDKLTDLFIIIGCQRLLALVIDLAR